MPILCGSFGGARLIRLNNPGESDTLARRLQFAQHTQMIASKGARARNHNVQVGLACYRAAPFSGTAPSTARKQRR